MKYTKAVRINIKKNMWKIASNMLTFADIVKIIAVQIPAKLPSKVQL
jgi:hypothetical protein